jgi:uncharacterized membrane protein YedE/YeeE
MMDRLTAILSGTVFGVGLALSGMVNPMKVQNFLDIFGTWDPTLMFVMGAGLAITFFGYRAVMKRPQPLFAESFHLPEACFIDRRLLAGAALFGIGWGLTGLCPGPAIASLVFGFWPSVLFVAAMAAGMLVVRKVLTRTQQNHRADG